MIYVVGIGPGHKDYILPKAIKTINKSDLVIGFKRALDSLEIQDSNKVYLEKLSDIEEYVQEEKYRNLEISILASGDPLFYGISNYVKTKSKFEIEIVPGLSSFQYLLSKVNIPWNNAYVGSMHGRNEEFLEIIRKNKLSVWLTDKQNNPAFLCEILNKENINCRVIIGENLSYDDEKISIGSQKEFINNNFSSLSIFIVDRN